MTKPINKNTKETNELNALKDLVKNFAQNKIYNNNAKNKKKLMVK